MILLRTSRVRHITRIADTLQLFLFFFNDTTTTQIYTLSLHDALPIFARVAEEFRVPILLHFQHGVYNTDIQNFHKTLEKFPRVNFIGHAQTWWGNVDAKHDQKVLYPTGQVTPGGITDRLLADYPNMFGDHSAGSGLNFLTRDPDFAAGFLVRHQDKLLFGSD